MSRHPALLPKSARVSNSGRSTRLRNERQGPGARSQRALACAATAGDAVPPAGDAVSRRAFVTTAAAFSAAAVTGLAACGRRTPDRAHPGRPVSYAFADEFNGPAGSAPDPSKWTYDVGGGGWGSNQLQIYTSSRENSFLDGNGNLVIRATKTTETSGGRTTTYRSARLTTLGKFGKYHGSFEARIKLDIRRGLWPAWWAIGANFPQVGWPACGEVDMLENYGGAHVQTSVHTPDNARTSVLTKHADIAVDDAWHTWLMWWNPKTGGFTFYKDGVAYLTVEPTQLANWCFSSGVPLCTILNLAVGGGVGPPPANVQFPVDLLVDYVRVW
jgi:beta-glucanase (GH16 family)